MGKLVVCVAVVCTAAVCGAAAVLLMMRRMKNCGEWGKAMAMLKEFEEKCATPVEKLRQVADAMSVEMHAGLASEGGSKLKMLISYVDNLPTGNEMKQKCKAKSPDFMEWPYGIISLTVPEVVESSSHDKMAFNPNNSGTSNCWIP
ncbi:Hexokinase-1 [Capsicum chinense]|nr:Hexokinase-1 [Capsicum chinense]